MSRPLLSYAVFLFVSVSVLGGMHAYLWWRLVRGPRLPGTWGRIATLLLVLLALGVPVGIFMARSSTGWVARVAPVAAATWLGIAFILFSTLLAFDLVRLAGDGLAFVLDWIRTRPDPPADPDRRLLLARALAGGAVVVAGGVTAYSMRSALGPARITEVPVRLERLPPALSGLTIAQISDLHVGPTLRDAEVRRVVEQTNALRPDLVAITGDLVDGSVPELGAATAHLAALRARYGVVFVTGNHEYYAGALGSALAGRDPDRSLVLLQHQPRGVEEAVRSGVELQLSGHTHGGQIFPFNFLVAAAYPYIAGLYHHREAARSGQIFVSRGTGFWGPPMRLGSPPEIAKIVLTR
jgi:predicted MPP superfamily phosphohydrolase